MPCIRCLWMTRWCLSMALPSSRDQKKAQQRWPTYVFIRKLMKNLENINNIIYDEVVGQRRRIIKLLHLVGFLRSQCLFSYCPLCESWRGILLKLPNKNMARQLFWKAAMCYSLGRKFLWAFERTEPTLKERWSVLGY